MVMDSKFVKCTVFTLILSAIILGLGFFISIFSEPLPIWPFNVFWTSHAQLKTEKSDSPTETIQINDLTSKLLERANKVIAGGNNQAAPLIPWLGEGEKAEAYIDTTQVN